MTIIQLLVALGISVAFMVVFREWKPFYEIETDILSYICGTLAWYLQLIVFVRLHITRDSSTIC